MSTQESTWPAVAPFPSPTAPLHRLSVEQYERMIEAGILGENDKVELIEGLIVEMSPIGSAHWYVVFELTKAISRLAGDGWLVFSQGPIVLPNGEPEPDICVVRGTSSDYKSRKPRANDVALLVEVADTSLEFDRQIKLRTYAAAGIPEYWIVNLRARELEIHRGPRVPADTAGPVYDSHEFTTDKGIISLVLDGQLHGAIALASVLP
jgi:Uma2 family endonuclease